MKTRKIINYIGMICLGSVLMGCNQKEIIQETAGLNSPVQFSACILNTPMTRTGAASDNAADRTQFKAGDVIAFLNTSSNVFVNYKYNDNKWAPVEGKPIIWNSDRMQCILFSPAEASNESYKIPNDQSTEAKLDFADLKGYQNVHSVNEGVITIAFERQTAKIVIDPHFNMEFGDIVPSIDEIKVCGNTKRLPGDTDILEYITPYLKDGKYILLTNELQNDPEGIFIKIKCTDSHGMKYEYEVKGIPEIKRSQSYIFHLDIGKNIITTGSINFGSWDAAVETIPGGTALKKSLIDPVAHTIITAYPGVLTREMLIEGLAGGTEIHIGGDLNGSDLKYIREAAGCASEVNSTNKPTPIIKNLDMSEANIIGGGEAYVINKGTPLKSSNNHIGTYLFYESALDSLTLPKSATELEHLAISRGSIAKLILPEKLEIIYNNAINALPLLTSIQLPEGLKTITSRAIAGTNIEELIIPASVNIVGTLDMDNNQLQVIKILGEKRNRPGNTDMFDIDFVNKDRSINYDLYLDKSWTPDLSVNEKKQFVFRNKVWKRVFYLDGTEVQPDKFKPDFEKSPEVTGYAVRFNHAGIVAGSEILTLNTGVTYEALVKFNSFNDNNTIIGAEGELLLRVGDVGGGVANNLLQISGRYNVPITSSTKNALKPNVWYHVAFTQDKQSEICCLYINGVEIGRSMVDRIYNFVVGGNYDEGNGLYVGLLSGFRYGDRPFDGMMKEVRIWNKNRTQQEIYNNMLSVSPSSPGLIRYYKLDGSDLLSNSVRDASGHSDGIIVKEKNQSNCSLTKVSAN